MFVDSHCHLDKLDKSPSELAEAVNFAQQRGVEHMLCVAVSVSEFDDMVETVSEFDNVSVSCGVHPCYEDEMTDYDTLLGYAALDKVVAVGETGLDYYHSTDTKAVQQRSFIDHIKVASQVGKPLIIHTRNARELSLIHI